MVENEDWTKISFFRKSEFACNCGCGLNDVDFESVKKLDMARRLSGFPFVLNSACRCPKHNAKVGGAVSSSHLPSQFRKACAFDIRVDDPVMRMAIVRSLLTVGFSRIGISNEYVHVDADKSKQQNIIWLY